MPQTIAGGAPTPPSLGGALPAALPARDAHAAQMDMTKDPMALLRMFAQQVAIRRPISTRRVRRRASSIIRCRIRSSWR